MNKKEKFASITAGLGEVLDRIEPRATESAPRTAPGQLMAFRNEMVAYEVKIAALETKVKDLETTAIPVAEISPNPWQPRRVFDEAEIQKLAGSIAEVGLIQPVIVRSVSNADTLSGSESVSNADTLSGEKIVGIPDTRYQIVAGERRWRAHKTLGYIDIKAIVIQVTDEEMAALALAENFDREDLTAYEIGVAIKNAESAYPNRKSLAGALGINRTDLYKYLSFFQLPAFIIDDLELRPGLLGRHAAEDISAIIKKHGDRATQSLRQLWPRVISGELDQGKIAALIEAAVTRGDKIPVQRDIRKLFVGKEQAGSITRDAGKLKIEIKVAALTTEKETELRSFVERMFS
jgi:ParB family chromosome partitioning protein